MQLIIGNKNYFSWSLRPWLLGQFSIAEPEVLATEVAGGPEQSNV
jgi:hypothetical protein